MFKKWSKLLLLGLLMALTLILSVGVSGSEAQDRVAAVGTAGPPSNGTTPPAYPAIAYQRNPSGASSTNLHFGDISIPSGSSPSMSVVYSGSDQGNSATGQPADPYKGGYLDFTWKQNITLTVQKAGLSSDDVDLRDHGLGFVGIITLPESYSELNLYNAIIQNSDTTNSQSPYFILNGKRLSITDNPSTLRVAGQRLLRFSLGTKDVSKTNLYQFLKDAGLMKTDFVWIATTTTINFDLELHFTVDVAKMTAVGDVHDSSPAKILTSGKLPPAFTTPNISVGLYDSKNILQAAGPSGVMYPKLNSAGLPTTPTSSTSFALPFWRQYISPADNTGKYNTNADTSEYVAGSNLNLPGTTSNRNVTIAESEGRFSSLPGNRFNRVVDYYTGFNVSASSVLSHTPLTTAGINIPTKVWYTGTGSDGKALSPVALLVTDTSDIADADMPVVKGTSKVTNTETGASGTSIEAISGDKILEEHNFTLTNLGNKKLAISNQKVTVKLPPNLTFIANSLKINDTSATGIVSENGLTVTLPKNLVAVNDTVKLEFSYTVNSPFSNNITTVKGNFTGNVTSGASTIIVSADSTSNTIIPAPAALTFLKIPTLIDFGSDNPLPYTETIYKQKDTDMRIVVSNTLTTKTPWKISLALTKDFTTDDGHTLIDQLRFQNKVLGSSPTSIYSDDGVPSRKITKNPSSDDKFSLEVGDGSGALPDVEYDATLTWSLSTGPTN